MGIILIKDLKTGETTTLDGVAKIEFSLTRPYLNLESPFQIMDEKGEDFYAEHPDFKASN